MKKKIEIPEEVYKCVQDGSYCGSLFEELQAAIPYNPSGDYVSRDALKKELLNPTDNIYLSYGILEVVFRSIDNAPAIEITEEQAINKLHETGWLVEHDKEMTTRPQGEWMPKRLWDNTHIWVCSECGNQNKHGITVEKACWKCGAKMKGGAE